MANFKLAFVALLLEISSWTVSGFLTQSSDSALWGYLALHALASAVLAFSMLPLLLGKHTQPRWAVVGLIACFCFAIPVLGFVLAFLAVMTVRVYPSRDPTEDFSSVVLPEFDQHQHLPGTAQTSGIRSLLSNREAPTKLRFKALVTLSHVKGGLPPPCCAMYWTTPATTCACWPTACWTAWSKSSPGPSTKSCRSSRKKPLGLPRFPRGWWRRTAFPICTGNCCTRSWPRTICTTSPYRSRCATATWCCASSRRTAAGAAPRPSAARHGSPAGSRAVLCQGSGAGHAGDPGHSYQAQIRYAQRDFVQVRSMMQGIAQHNALPKLRPVIDYWS
jgi:hypothetical protein